MLQENFFDIQEALQAIHMRQEMLREQLACAKSKGEETVGRNLQVGPTWTTSRNASARETRQTTEDFTAGILPSAFTKPLDYSHLITV